MPIQPDVALTIAGGGRLRAPRRNQRFLAAADFFFWLPAGNAHATAAGAPDPSGARGAQHGRPRTTIDTSLRFSPISVSRRDDPRSRPGQR
jgi:hypothetical protein